jgi:Phosphotransferase enzyme family
MAGGFSNVVSRKGDLVKRRIGTQSPATHQLLTWLRLREFKRVPELLEITPEEELLSYLAGEPVFRPWSEVVRTDHWMAELGTWLCEYHAAVSGFTVQSDARFLWGPGRPEAGMVVNHGDLGPWNVIQKDGRVSGVIDWDMARFGDPLDDLSQLALENVPLKPSTAGRLGAAPDIDVLRRRLRVLCEAYGESDLDKVLRHTVHYLARMAKEIEELAGQGRSPFVRYVKDRVPEDYRAEARFILKLFNLERVFT